MKKLAATLLSILALFFSASVVFAQGVSTGQNVYLSSTEILNQDYLAAGNNVTVAGTVNGDVYVAGGQVSINGKVNGDLLVVGGQVTVSGEISQDVRVLGGQVTISGKIGRSLTIGAGTVTLGSGALVTKNIVAVAGNLDLSGEVGGNVKIAGGNLLVDGKIAGDLDASTGTNNVSSDTIIGGNFNYWSDQKASIDSKAKISGKTEQHPAINHPEFEAAGASALVARFSNVIRLMSFVGTVVIGLLLIYLFPSFIRKTKDELKAKPWASLGWGLVLLFLTPIISIVIFVTIIGIPLALITLSLYFIALFVSRLVVMYWMGSEVIERTNQNQSNFWALTVGVIAYFLLTLVPLLSGFLTFFSIVFGLGAGLLAVRGKNLPVKKS